MGVDVIVSEPTRQCAPWISAPQQGALSTRKSPARGSAGHQGLRGPTSLSPNRPRPAHLFAARCDNLMTDYRLSPEGESRRPPHWDGQDAKEPRPCWGAMGVGA